MHAAHKHCMEYFDLAPSVRTVVLLRFGERKCTDRRFEAIGILYRRGNNGRPKIQDAVSFGTAPIPIQTLEHELSCDVLPVFRAFPVPHLRPDRSLPEANPWADRNPFISLPAADIFYLQDGVPGGRPSMIPGTPDHAPPLRLDLYKILRKIVRLDPFNAPTDSRQNHHNRRVGGFHLADLAPGIVRDRQGPQGRRRAGKRARRRPD